MGALWKAQKRYGQIGLGKASGNWHGAVASRKCVSSGHRLYKLCMAEEEEHFELLL